MRRAIRLAMNGRGAVEPNPMVGCVIVKNGQLIGEGYHERFGGPHAEPSALAACTESPEGATAYVTLEPCCHTNKKTPPCVPALVQAKLARVVIGCRDWNPQVSGRGLRALAEAGIAVTNGVMEREAKQLAAAHFADISGRPYVTLKWAQSADGKIAGPGGERVQISNEASRRVVHELRARCDAIIVGINTVLADDPLLTVRGVTKARPLTRYVLDRKLRIPFRSRLVETARQSPVVIISDLNAWKTKLDFGIIQQLGAKGVEIPLPPPPGLRALLPHLHKRNIVHALVEPGPTLAKAFFDEDCADRLWVFYSPKRIDDPSAPDAAQIPGQWIKAGEVDLDGDRLVEYLNTKSRVFFAPEPSADFVLTADAHRSSSH